MSPVRPIGQAVMSSAMMWSPSRDAGLERLATFVPHAGRHYATMRNHDLGPEDRSNISGLSPWLRHRLITEEEVLRATLQRHDFSAAQSFISEVFWRTYFKGWLEHRPAVWTSYRSDVDRLLQRCDDDVVLAEDVASACNGTTGIVCLDAWARELVETGYLHNHTRMWFASIWIFTLRLPWQLGANFFLRHLRDGDPASNTLSWRWVAGLHTAGKTYLATAEDIMRFTDGRFGDAERLSRQLATEAVPLEDERDFDPQPMVLPDTQPIKPPAGLVVTEDDGWGTPVPGLNAARGVIGLDLSEKRAQGGVSDDVRAFGRGAVRDAVARTAARFACDDVPDEPVTDFDGLIAWAESAGLSTLVLAAPPKGHVTDALTAASSQLESAGLDFVRFPRIYDRTCWPHATRGFFKLKKKIPSLLKELGIDNSRVADTPCQER